MYKRQAFSRASIVNLDAKAKVNPNTEAEVDIIEEVFTEDESALSAGESASTDCTKTRTVQKLSDVVLKELDPTDNEVITTNADVVSKPGTSSHNDRNEFDRGRKKFRTQSRSSRDSMTPPPYERDMSCANKSTVSSKKNRTLTVTAQRSRSLLAERRIPGHVSITSTTAVNVATTSKRKEARMTFGPFFPPNNFRQYFFYTSCANIFQNFEFVILTKFKSKTKNYISIISRIFQIVTLYFGYHDDTSETPALRCRSLSEKFYFHLSTKH